jgi:hypothetical protein
MCRKQKQHFEDEWSSKQMDIWTGAIPSIYLAVMIRKFRRYLPKVAHA